MKYSLNQRVADVVKFLIFSNAALDKQDLSKKIGYNASSFSQIINGRVPVSDRFVERLLAFAPNINEKWLLTGEGEMLNQSPVSLVTHDTRAEPIDETNGVPLSIVSTEIVEELKAEIKEAMAIPIISTEIASRPNLNIRKYIDDKAGELEHIDPSDLTHQADGAERIRKTSMLPTFAPGDIVFVRFLNDKRNIIDGHTYYFDMRTRPTMIRRVKMEGDKLRLIAKNPAFGDIIVSYDEVLNIADIVGLFRSSFGDQYDEIETVRRRKDEQIDNLISELGKAGARVDKMGEQVSRVLDLMEQKLR